MSEILSRLKINRVFYILPDSFGKFEITEGCDDYYSVVLNQVELLQLADEIRELATKPQTGVLERDCIDE